MNTLTLLPKTVRELTFDHLGAAISVQGWTYGWLYVIEDRFSDGYPNRTLTLVIDDDGNSATKEFTDSDPHGYPQTLSTVVEPWIGAPE